MLVKIIAKFIEIILCNIYGIIHQDITLYTINYLKHKFNFHIPSCTLFCSNYKIISQGEILYNSLINWDFFNKQETPLICKEQNALYKHFFKQTMALARSIWNCFNKGKCLYLVFSIINAISAPWIQDKETLSFINYWNFT